MGDCADGPAFAIWVDNFKVQGHIELMQDQGIVDYVIESTNVRLLFYKSILNKV